MSTVLRNLGSARRPLRLGALALVAALVVSYAVFVPTSRGVAPAVPRCATSNLRLDKVGEDDFTSHRGWIFAFRNIAPATCHLKGFPDVRLLDATAHPEPTVMLHFLGPPHNVVLTHFNRAFFTVTFAVSGPCPAAVFAYGLRVVPPGDVARLVHYAGKFDLCGPGPARLSISPVRPHL